jgi:hypothetical protein
VDNVIVAFFGTKSTENPPELNSLDPNESDSQLLAFHFPGTLKCINDPIALNLSTNQVLNKWQQPVAFWRFLIDRHGGALDGIVLDLCAGTGSASTAALSLQRSVIAFDNDEACVLYAINQFNAFRAKHVEFEQQNQAVQPTRCSTELPLTPASHPPVPPETPSTGYGFQLLDQ